MVVRSVEHCAKKLEAEILNNWGKLTLLIQIRSTSNLHSALSIHRYKASATSTQARTRYGGEEGEVASTVSSNESHAQM